MCEMTWPPPTGEPWLICDTRKWFWVVPATMCLLLGRRLCRKKNHGKIKKKLPLAVPQCYATFPKKIRVHLHVMENSSCLVSHLPSLFVYWCLYIHWNHRAFPFFTLTPKPPTGFLKLAQILFCQCFPNTCRSFQPWSRACSSSNVLLSSVANRETSMASTQAAVDHSGTDTVFMVIVLVSVVGGVFVLFALMALCYRSVTVHSNLSLCLRLVLLRRATFKLNHICQLYLNSVFTSTLFPAHLHSS